MILFEFRRLIFYIKPVISYSDELRCHRKLENSTLKTNIKADGLKSFILSRVIFR